MTDEQETLHRQHMLDHARKAREAFLREMTRERAVTKPTDLDINPAKSPAQILRDRMLRR